MVKKDKLKNKRNLVVSISYIVVGLILFALIIYKYLKTGNINNCNIEITILLLVSVIYFLYYSIIQKVRIPENIKGKQLPIKDNKKSKKIRMKSYCFKSLIFTIIMVTFYTMAYLFNNDFKHIIEVNTSSFLNTIYNLLIVFLLSFIISFSLEIIVGESSIKKLNKKL